MFRGKIHRILLACVDAALVAAALGLAYMLRRDFEFAKVMPEWPIYRIQYICIVPIVIIIRLCLFYFFKLYKGILRYASVNELTAIIASSTIGTIIFFIFNLVMEMLPRLGYMPLNETGEHVRRVPLGVVFGEWVLVILLIGGARFTRRIILNFGKRVPQNARRVMIVGAGDTGEAVARQLIKNPGRGYYPVCFIDDNPLVRGKQIHRLPVVASLDKAGEMIEEYRIDDIIVAIPNMPPKKLSQLVAECKNSSVVLRIAPNVHDLIEGKIEVSQIRTVEIEDLLGREPVRLALAEDMNYIRGETILITGAGGSIGSELCRQLILYKPKRLLLLGKGENSIYEIAAEFRYDFKTQDVIPIIADITDRSRLRQIFEEYKPSICFHAAAHKHVPLMEIYPEEAVKNNIVGTRNVAELSDEFGLKIFVLISTDKAVHPTNVMGATKRMAELIIFTLAERSGTSFVAVRFGNVLGSRGSVVPLFKKQIQRGGPVTVTHKEVMRYFMTIPEAVSLVIQTGAMREKGRLFLLDMGEPVKIADLAKNLITLSGFEPGKDIEVVYTGLRPGEKLKEELLTEGEGIQKTDFGKIFFTQAKGSDWQVLLQNIEALKGFAKKGDRENIRKLLKEILPDYKDQGS